MRLIMNLSWRYYSVQYWLVLGHLEISASASALRSALASALQKIYFVLRSLYFWLLKFYIKKIWMVKYFSSTLSDLPGSFRRCLEQLFCRKPVSAWF